MLGGGVFVFCSMLSVQGLAQLLPRQAFLRISAALQMIFFGLLLTVYFLQPGFSTLDSLAANQNMLYWLPSYWFLGLFESLNGTAMPTQLGFLARRAFIALGLALLGAALAYLICYFRTLRKIAEQPDILPGRAGLHWLPKFGAAFPTQSSSSASAPSCAAASIAWCSLFIWDSLSASPFSSPKPPYCKNRSRQAIPGIK
jgi:hypothetical protein